MVSEVQFIQYAVRFYFIFPVAPLLRHLQTSKDEAKPRTEPCRRSISGERPADAGNTREENVSLKSSTVLTVQ